MIAQPAEPTARAAVARAVVCACGVDTPYLRTGRGDAVLIVADDIDSTVVQQMMSSLGASHLVLAASPRVSGAGFASWRANFLEALGLADAHLLLVSPCGAEVLPEVRGEAG